MVPLVPLDSMVHWRVLAAYVKVRQFHVRLHASQQVAAQQGISQGPPARRSALCSAAAVHARASARVETETTSSAVPVTKPPPQWRVLESRVHRMTAVGANVGDADGAAVGAADGADVGRRVMRTLVRETHTRSWLVLMPPFCRRLVRMPA